MIALLRCVSLPCSNVVCTNICLRITVRRIWTHVCLNIRVLYTCMSMKEFNSAVFAHLQERCETALISCLFVLICLWYSRAYLCL